MLIQMFARIFPDSSPRPDITRERQREHPKDAGHREEPVSLSKATQAHRHPLHNLDFLESLACDIFQSFSAKASLTDPKTDHPSGSGTV